MFRSSSTPAIVLRKTRIGEIHKGLTLLTPGLGLVHAVAHGAYKLKSRLRSASEPFTVIRAYLYHEPVKGQFKLTDAELLHLLEGIRRSVIRFYTASLWAEVTLKSFAAGESYGELYRLLFEALLLLDAAPEGRAALLSAQFVMRFLDLSGHRPDLERCAGCQAPFGPGEAAFLAAQEEALVCGRCAAAGALLVPAGARVYLQRTAGQPLAQAVRVSLEGESLQALQKVMALLVQSSLETGLNTLRVAGGVL